MAEIIGYDPVTGDPIWSDPTLNTPVPEPLPTLPGSITTEPEPDPIQVDTAVYMVSTQPMPDPDDVPDTTHQGIHFTDREVYEVVDAAVWISRIVGRKTVTVMLVVDDVDERDAPIYNVDVTVMPIKISSARN